MDEDFEIKDGKIIKIKSSDAISRNIDDIAVKKDKDGKKHFYIEDDSGKEYAFDDKLNATINKAKKNKKLFSSDRDFDDIFNKLGKCAALRSMNKLFGFIGKDPKAQDVIKTLDDIDMDDIYNLAFQDKKGIEKDDFAGKTPNEIIDACAKMNAVNSLKNDGKIDDGTFNTLVNADTDNIIKKYTDGIKSNSVTRNRFESFENKYIDEFQNGFDEYQKIIKEGDKEKLKDLKEPFTNNKIPETEWKKLSGAIDVAGKAVAAIGKGIGNILDITENSPDIYSKMIFALIGGGKKLLKNIQKQNVLKRFAAYKKITATGFRKTVNDSISAIKKNGLIKKANEAK